MHKIILGAIFSTVILSAPANAEPRQIGRWSQYKATMEDFRKSDPSVRFAFVGGDYGATNTETPEGEAQYWKELDGRPNAKACNLKIAESMLSYVPTVKVLNPGWLEGVMNFGNSRFVDQLELVRLAVISRFGENARAEITYEMEAAFVPIPRKYPLNIVVRIYSDEFAKRIPGVRWVEARIEDYALAVNSGEAFQNGVEHHEC